MKWFVGVWKLDDPFYCKKELSGKGFQSVIGNVNITLCLPSIPNDYAIGTHSLADGDLIAPLPLFQKQVNWGTIHEWPKGLFSVKAVSIIWQGEEKQVKSVYEDFPRWKDKFYDLVLINSGNFVRPEQKQLCLLQNGQGFYEGLEVFCVDDKQLKREINCYSSSVIQLQMVGEKQCYDVDVVRKLFDDTGNEKEIALPYELLIVAYRAVIRNDFRSAVIVGATALEKAILHKIETFYKENALTTFEADKKNHKMLGKEFQWLKELQIEIPVDNYQHGILEIRNETTHEGKKATFDEVMNYLENCKSIIQAYNPSVLEI